MRAVPLPVLRPTLPLMEESMEENMLRVFAPTPESDSDTLER